MSGEVLNDEQRHMLKIVTLAAKQLGLEVVMIGAMARLFRVDLAVPGTVGRATFDIDLTLQVSSWTEFDQLKKALVEQGFRPDPVAQQRLWFGDDLLLDLVPFGDIACGGKISWPKSDLEMDTTGLPEAFELATPIEIEDVGVLRVVRAHELLTLKLLAWRDRRDSAPRRDAPDIATLLTRVEELVGGPHVLYDEHLEIIELHDFDLERAATDLFARELARGQGENTRQALINLLELELEDPEASRLVSDLARELPGRNRLRALAFIHALETGLRAALPFGLKSANREKSPGFGCGSAAGDPGRQSHKASNKGSRTGSPNRSAPKP